VSEFSIVNDAPRLARLADQGIFIGTSSWNYEGWLGQVYPVDVYAGPRKSFVISKFREKALEDYAKVFRTVCFDGAYWKLPTHEQMKAFESSLPEGFQFAMKVTDTITLRRYPNTKMSGDRAGQLNASFLDSELFIQHFLEPSREALGKKLGPVILEFSPFFFGKPFGIKAGYQPLDFVKNLHRFLSAIPESLKKETKLAVEVRDPEFLDPSFSRYLDCLRYHGVSHVLNEQTWMPPIEEQLKHPAILTAPFTVVRALVRAGVTHEAAVKEFHPYTTTQLVLPGMRLAIVDLMQRSLSQRRGLYVYNNNRSEGNSPNTIAGILDLFDESTDLFEENSTE
jgi:uncharacterized protein YecE (DUF72 family)